MDGTPLPPPGVNAFSGQAPPPIVPNDRGYETMAAQPPSYAPPPGYVPAQPVSSNGAFKWALVVVAVVVLGIAGVVSVAVFMMMSQQPSSADNGGSQGPAGASTTRSTVEVKASLSELKLEASSTRSSPTSRTGQQIRTDVFAVMDGDLATSWCEQEPSPNENGAGSWITFETRNGSEEELASISITPGYIKGQEGATRQQSTTNWDRWPVNNRASEIEVESSGGGMARFPLDPNLRSMQVVTMPTGFRGRLFKIRFSSVKKGTDSSNDLCISEIELRFRRTVQESAN